MALLYQSYTWIPFQKIKCGYGLIKLHKENYELRPIVSSYNTITSNSESCLLKFLKPLESKIRYSVKYWKIKISVITN